MIDCAIYQGNSGSPVLNQQGKIIGILHAGYWSEERQHKNYGIDGKSRVWGIGSNHAYFTNLMCVADPVTKQELAPECQQSANMSLLDCTDQGLISAPMLRNQYNSDFMFPLVERLIQQQENQRQTPELKSKKIKELQEKGLCP